MIAVGSIYTIKSSHFYEVIEPKSFFGILFRSKRKQFTYLLKEFCQEIDLL